MKKLFALLLSILLLNMICLSAHCKTVEVRVKESTRVEITVPVSINSKNVVAGEKINAIVTEDVKVNGVLIFKKDAPAIINVSEVDKNGFIGKPGEIVIYGAQIQDVNGEMHSADINYRITGKEKTYPKVLLAVSIFFLFPLALFGFVKGGHAEIPAYKPIEVRTRNEFEFTPNL